MEVLNDELSNFKTKQEKLQKIIDICDQDFDISDSDLYSISSKAKLVIYAMKVELDQLEKKSKCNHEKVSTRVWVGNTHTKDFYHDICDKCGKVFEEYSI